MNDDEFGEKVDRALGHVSASPSVGKWRDPAVQGSRRPGFIGRPLLAMVLAAGGVSAIGIGAAAVASVHHPPSPTPTVASTAPIALHTPSPTASATRTPTAHATGSASPVLTAKPSPPPVTPPCVSEHPAGTVCGTFAAFKLPTPNAIPSSIVSGLDGDLWFLEGTTLDAGGNKVGRMSTAGVLLSEWTIPTPDSEPSGITIGPLGMVWVTEWKGNKLARVSPNGTILEIPLPGQGAHGSTLGTDGNYWIPESFSGDIAVVSPSTLKVVADYPTGAGTYPLNPIRGFDNQVWFIKQGSGPEGNRVAEISSAGVITDRYTLPASGAPARTLIPTFDGNCWVFDRNAPTVLKLAPSGAVTAYPVPDSAFIGGGATTGPDGNLWFTSTIPGQVWRMRLSDDTLTSFSDPSIAGVGGIAIGVDHNLWVTVGNTNSIVRLS